MKIETDNKGAMKTMKTMVGMVAFVSLPAMMEKNIASLKSFLDFHSGSGSM